MRKRIQKRFITRFGTAGSANLRYMTGKQAVAYGKSIGRDNRARYGESFQPR